MSRFVPHHSVEFRLRRTHRKAFKVHRGLARSAAEDVRSEIGPIAPIRTSGARDANLWFDAGLSKLYVPCLAPSIHMHQDAGGEVCWRVIQKSHGELDAS